MAVRLIVNDATLFLDWNDQHWCHLSIQIGFKTACLGADMKDIVKRRLCSALEAVMPDRSVGIINGLKVNSVITLLEDYGTIYVGQYSRNRMLFFRNADGVDIGAISLNEEQRAKWLNQVKEL